jgi:alpha-glucosidase
MQEEVEKKKEEVSVGAKKELTPTKQDATTLPSDISDVPEPETPATALLSEVDLSKRYSDVLHPVMPDAVTPVGWFDGAYVFACENGITLRVYVIENGILRFWYHPTGQYVADFSYAISPDFTPEKPFATLTENENEYVVATPLMQVVVQRARLSVKVYDAFDTLMLEDGAGYSATLSMMHGWTDIKNSFKLPKRTGFYGLGDKSTPGNLRGKSFSNWCSDSYGFGDQSGEWYRAIPFFYAKSATNTYGIFLDNTYRTAFDFGENDPNAFTIGAQGGDLNFYLLAGPTPNEVSARYHRLTGVHQLPPIWALGYHQCRWSYLPDTRVRAVAKQFRDLQIPCDAIYLDIDYMDAYKVFTWDKQAFPNPGGLISELEMEYAMKTVVMLNPGVKVEKGFDVYETGVKEGYFVKNAEGELSLGPVWPGLCAFPDFTNPKVRKWFGSLYQDLYIEKGVAGFWNDMNEPAVFYVESKTLPNTTMHHYDGHGASHKKAHNIYGMQMARSSYEGMRALKPESRPFLLTRANYSGGQRFAALWTGDNYASWQHLQIANVQSVRLSISGYSFVGSDIGGFAGEPEPELYLRWLQLSVFHPLMRVHSQGNHAGGDSLLEAAVARNDREPWAFGEKWTALNKKAIELRYFMLACLYTAFWRLRHTGKPIMRPLAFEDTDTRNQENDRDFLFGDHIIVSPVTASKVQRQMVNLPVGNWYYFWNGQIIQGGSDCFVNVQLEEVPFFVREGAVLPIYPVRQNTSEPVKEMTLYAYYKIGTETSYLYEDDGDGYDNEQNDWSSRMEIFAEGDQKTFGLKAKYCGARPVTHEKVTVIAVGLPYFVRKCMVDGAEFPIREIRVREKSIYSVQLQPGFNQITWSGEVTS